MKSNSSLVAIVLFVALISVVSGQGTISYCRTNSDCNQTASLCCSASSTGAIAYIQFNCATISSPGKTSTGTCLTNGTDYKSACTGQAKTCLKSDTKFAACGGSIAMGAVDVLPNISCVSGASGLGAAGFLALAGVVLSNLY